MNRFTNDRSQTTERTNNENHEQERQVPTRKQRYVDRPAPEINAVHVSFVHQEQTHSLDARESLDIPLASFTTKEPKEESDTATSLPKPGINQPLRPSTMPDPDRVSELPETDRERHYMIEKNHQPTGPHVIIDTPIPESSPSIDTLSPEVQRNRSMRTNMEQFVEIRPIADAEETSLQQTATDTVLQVVGLEKSYRKASIVIPVLRGVDLTVKTGEFVSIIGQSGSGKSTLLHLLGTLDSPDAGEIYFHGYRIDNLPSRHRDMLRNDRFGMIFQFYHLLPELNVLENVLAPLLIRESMVGYFLRRRAYRRRAIELIDAVGLGHRLKHRPRELSGGEMQRAAIARALISQPELLLADEPTGNLDQETGAEIIELLGRLKREQNLTILMVTHDRELAETADQTIGLVDGRIA